MKQQVFKALGMMSGTSLDGVDLCLVRTDGENVVEVLGRHYVPYAADLRQQLGVLAKGDLPLNEVLRLERRVSEVYAGAALASGLLAGVEVVGCHGQTIRHLPKEGLTWQLGDASYLAERVGVPVVMDFRRRDMAAGGEGAPLVPLFHAVMLAGVGKPAAMLNVGGVSNVSVVAEGGEVRASDCGPGMGLLDAWVKQCGRGDFDVEGALALAGTVDAGIVSRALAEVGFWQRRAPHSADRYEFDEVLEWLAGSSVEDGAATLAALTVAGVEKTLRDLGVEGLKEIYVCGGGARNRAVLAGLGRLAVVRDVKELGMDEQAVEAACFGWLAVRRLRGLPTTLPATTGCVRPTCGGVLTV